MIRYFRKSFVRYLAYGLAIALVTFLIGLIKANAEEYESMTVTGTSLHTYISNASVGNSSLVTFSSPTYREITASQGSYTWAVSSSSSPKFITKLAYNVFGDFRSNTTYKIHWEINFPNDMNINEFSCSMGSYTNNTAFPPYSLSSCTIQRSDRGNAIIEGLITIQQGQYVTVVITPKIGIDTSHVYEIGVDLPNLIETNFTLNYGNVQVYKMLSVITAVGGVATQIGDVVDGVDGVKDSVDGVKDSVDDLNDSINNDNVNDANSQATSFFNNFSTNTHGLTGIITAPLNAISSITSATCSPLVIPLPFVDEDLTLPCMRTVYEEFFGDFMTLYDVIVTGIIAYWIMVRIFGLVKDFKNPEHDEIEVMEL